MIAATVICAGLIILIKFVKNCLTRDTISIGGIYMELKNMRQKERITIAEMGLYMKVPRKMISLWESGKIPMTPIEYEKYLQILRDNRVKY